MKRTILFIFIIAAIAVGANTHIAEELKYYFDHHNVHDEGYEMVANYAQYGDTLLSKLPANPLTILAIGKWKGVSRQGTGMERDTLGRIIYGHYEADSLETGIRLDSAEIYAGDFSGLQVHGHGCCLTQDGTYYEGQWTDDQRDGFGIAVSPHSHLRVGQWKQNRFLGERMHYTSERIYGIDISRYQHGHGRKKYPILWNKLRISYLGSKNQKNAMGTVNYPVSFIFIKST